jgi:uncharacterized protein YutE (UPF0331/DUF86 family)
MAGFRNLAVHDYSSMRIEEVINIIENNLDDILKFAEIMVRQVEE